VEMRSCKESGFCCGAGGARMWLEENIGKRVNMERTEEALGTGADVVSTACPYCMIMLDDAVRAFSKEDEVRVLDLSQLVEESLGQPGGNGTGAAAPEPEPEPQPAGCPDLHPQPVRPFGLQREHQPLVRDHRGPVLVPVGMLARPEAVVLDKRVDSRVVRVGRHR